MPSYFFSFLIACNSDTLPSKDTLPPFSPIIEIEPSFPDTSTPLTARLLSVDLADPDTPSAELSLEWEWFKNGEKQALPANQTTIHSGMTSRGDVWALQARVFDGESYSRPERVETIIYNALPRVENIVTSTIAPRTDEDLVLENYDLRDADNDLLSMDLNWHKNGIHEQISDQSHAISSVMTQKGDEWILRITPNDGFDEGEPSLIYFNIQNTAPELDSLQVSPSNLDRTQFAEPAITAVDLDDDNLTTDYIWLKNGQVISGVESAPLSPNYFERGDEIQVEASVSDGESSSSTKRSNSIIVQNAIPSMTKATIEPIEATAEDNLSCSPIDAIDLDSDELTYVIDWSLDGVWISSAEILDSSLIAKNQIITCEIALYDGIDLSGIKSDSIEIGNSLPEIISIELTSPASSESVLFCMTEGFDHDQNDTVTFSYEWFVNGASIAHSGSYLSHFYYNLSPGDIVECKATPHDGDDFGTGLMSQAIELLAPTINLSGQTLLEGMPVGGMSLNSVGLISIQTESSILDGSYVIETPTLSFGSVSVNTPHDIYPTQIQLGVQDEIADFNILAATFPGPQDQLEPNDTIVDSSLLIVDGALRHGVIGSEWDEDIYEVALIANQTYAFFTTRLHWATTIELDLMDSFGNIIDSSSHCLGNEACLMEVTPVQDGSHYLRAHSPSNYPDRADYFIGAVTWQDTDLDGFIHHQDCDDSNPNVFVGNIEIPGDGIDQNCSGIDTPVAIGADSADPFDDNPAGAFTIDVSNDMPEEWFYRRDQANASVRILSADTTGSVSDIDYFTFTLPAQSQYRLRTDPSVSLSEQGCSIMASILDSNQTPLIGPIELTGENEVLIDNQSILADQRYIKIGAWTPCAYRLLLQSEGQDLDSDGHYNQSPIESRDINDLDASIQ